MPLKRRRGKRKPPEEEQENVAAAKGPMNPPSTYASPVESLSGGYEPVMSPLSASCTVDSPNELPLDQNTPLSRKPLRDVPLRRQSVKRKQPMDSSSTRGIKRLAKVHPSGSMKESTPATSHTRDSLYGFENLDSPLTASPIISSSPYGIRGSHSRELSSRSHSPASTSDGVTVGTSSVSRKLSDICYQPILATRARRRTKPRKKPDQVLYYIICTHI